MVGVLTEEEMQLFPGVEEEKEKELLDSKHLESRQCWDQAPVVRKKGNGNPKKWRLHKQITVRTALILSTSHFFHTDKLTTIL